MIVEVYNDKNLLEFSFENIKEIKHTIDKFIFISQYNEITVLNDDVRCIIKSY